MNAIASKLLLPGVAQLSQEEFYTSLVERNAGFIQVATQARLAGATILIAGCGSTGGACVDPLVRLGVQRLVLADLGRYELNNLNRQNATMFDIGRNKAEVAADRAAQINPYVQTTVIADGVTPVNALSLAAGAAVIIDGVDVTTSAGWRAKFWLHEAAAEAHVPVITGYDMAGCQYVRYYDYRVGLGAFGGALSDTDIRTRDSLQLLRRILPLRYVPAEMIEEVRRGLIEPERSVPQLVYASLLFGALASRMVVDSLDGRPIRRHTCLDVHQAISPRGARVGRAWRKPWIVASGLRELRRAAAGRPHRGANTNQP